MNINKRAFAFARANALLEVYSKLDAMLKNIPFALCAVALIGLVSLTANAATFTVTSMNDSGSGSLRQAVLDANNAPGADTIVFSPTVFNQQQQTIFLQTELSITQDLNINGGTATELWISGSGVGRIFNVNNATVEIRDLTLIAGRSISPNNGGAILVNGGTTSLSNVTMFSSSTSGNGGAMSVQTGTLNLNNVTLFGNQATQAGGAIHVDGASSAANLTNVSFSNNVGSTGGAIAISGGANVSVKNSAFGTNNGTAPNIAGTINSLGYNIIASTTGATINGTTTGNQLNVNPQFSGFNDFGGKTWTLGLLPTSPALDTGDPSQATSVDQRGSRRNTDGNNNGVAGVDVGAYEKQKSAFDLEGDGTADLSVVRESAGNLVWYGGITNISSRPESIGPNPNALSIQTFGLPTDVLAPADYDGDGKMDVAVFRPATGVWYVIRSTQGFAAFQWGINGDVPVPADYDGDGKADYAVFRSGVWYIFKSTGGFTGEITLGSGTSRPVPADYDGDLKADVGVFETNGLWTVNKSTGGQISEFFGISGDIPVPADFDGDGNDNLAVFRPADGTWYIKRPSGGYDAAPFGLSTDKPVPADYDGDGKVDIAVWRTNTQGGANWFIQQTRDGLVIPTFGLANDLPVANSRLNP